MKNTNRKTTILLSTALYLFLPLNILANNNEELKNSVTTFSNLEEKIKEIDDLTSEDIGFENREQAIKTDNEIIARESGFSIEIVNKSMLFQERFSKYLNQLFAKYPNRIEAAYLGGDLSELKGYIRFVGKVPKELSLSIKKLKQGEKIILIGGGKASIAEHKKQVQLIAEVLSNVKYQDSIVYYNQQKNKLEVEVKSSNKTKELTVNSLINAVEKYTNNFTSNRKTISFHEEDIRLKIIEGSEPLIVLNKTRGGSRIYNNSTPSSKGTSGWSVIVPGVGLAILTCGHGLVKDRINRHISGGGLNATYNMTLTRNIYHNNGGHDLAIYETPYTREEYKFWANEDNWRYTNNTRATNTMLGNRVCRYGRSSNIRTCNHTVKAVGLTMSLGGKIIHDIVRADNNSAINGDSGGGWSYNSDAWGIQTGSGHGYSYFTAIEEALAVFNAELF